MEIGVATNVKKAVRGGYKRLCSVLKGRQSASDASAK